MRTWNLEPRTWNCRGSGRPAFTLTELMIVIAIIAMLAGLGLSAMSGATTLAREQRAATMITKIDQLLMERYEGYRTRAVPIKIPIGTNPRIAAMIRLNAVRDLMRMELPDRKTDVVDPPCDCWPDVASGVIGVLTMSPAALQKSYQRKAMRTVGVTTLPALSAVWNEQYQSSECLYLILSTIRDGDKSALDYFDATEIGDVDGDGMNEILDGWGTPIEFIRWPAGYAEQMGPDGAWGKSGADDDGDGTIDNLTEAGWPGTDDSVPNSQGIGSVRTIQTKNYFRAPDPFDPVKVHGGTTGIPITLFATSGYTPGYLLHPLIVSAGPDKKLDIVTDLPTTPGFHYSPPYSTPATANNYPNPFVTISVKMGASGSSVTVPIGTPGDVDGDGYIGYTDNITNHDRASE